MGELGFCTIGDIISSAKTQITIDIFSDTGLPLLLIRYLHNKFSATIFFSLRCYLLYVDSTQLVRFIPFFLLPLIVYALFGKPRRRIIIFIQLLFPLFFMINPFHTSLGHRIQLFTLYYYGLSIIGIYKLIKQLLLKYHRRTPTLK